MEKGMQAIDDASHARKTAKAREEEGFGAL